MKTPKQHRILAAGLSILLSISTLSAPAFAEEADTLTDRNGDGIVDVFDIVLSKREAVEASRPLTFDFLPAEGNAGDTISVDVMLNNNTGISGMSMLIDYPEEFSPVYNENCCLSYELSEAFLNCGISISEVADRHLILIYNITPIEFYDSGPVMRLDFTIPKDTPAGEYPISFHNVQVKDMEQNNVTAVLVERGSIVVNEPPQEPVVTEPVTPPTAPPPPWGIDVSRWQGDINWNSVKNSGASFAMIRMGYGKYAKQADTKFVQNYNNAQAAGMPVGVYWYSYATTAADAVLEAKACLQVLGGRKLEYPIAFDIEERKQINLSPSAFCAVITAFCNVIEQAGYYAMVYGSANPLETHLDSAMRQRFDVWVAHYNVSKPKYSGNYGIWQYTSKGSVSGISGGVDCNYVYRDYPTIIKRAHLNGY